MGAVTKTFGWPTDIDGWADVGDSAITARYDAAGQAGGSIGFAGAASGTQERARSAGSETWETWGVPAGATVTAVQVTGWYSRKWAAPASQTPTLSARIIDTGNASVHSAGDLFSLGLGTGSDVAWVSHGAGTSRDVDSGKQASTTGVRLEIELDVTAASTTWDVGIDTVAVEITYTGGPPTFVAASAGATDAGGAWTATGVATGAIGDVVILQVLQDGTTDAAVTLDSATNIENLAGTDNAWTSIGAFDVGTGQQAIQRLWIGRRLSASAAPTATGSNSTSEDLYFRMYEFTNVNTGTTLATVLENGTAGATVNGTGDASPVADSSVETLGANRLALNFIAINDGVQAADLTAMTGESGGDWTYPTAAYGTETGTDGTIALVAASIAATGTIDGGSDAFTTGANWGVVGFALIGTAAGGTPHTATPADSITVADARAHGRGLGRTEALTVADAFARVTVTARTVPDTVAVADATTRAKTIPLALSDSFTLADSATPAKVRAAAVDDSVTLTDAVAKGRGLGLADTPTLTDARAFARGQAVADTVSLTDARALGRGLAAADSVTLADEATPDLTVGGGSHTVEPDDTVTVSDTVAIGQGKAVTDTATAADSFSRLHEASRAVDDTVSLTDARAHARGLAAADTVTLADEATPDISTGSTPHTVDVDDTVTVVSEATVAWAADRSGDDTVTITDELVRVHEAARSVADTAAVADAVAKARTLALADAVTVADEATPDLSSGSQSHTVDIDDTLTVASVISLVKNAAVPIADVIALSDTRVLARGLGVSDTLDLDDAFARVAAYIRDVDDSVTVPDGILKARGIGVADVLSVTDLADVLFNVVVPVDPFDAPTPNGQINTGSPEAIFVDSGTPGGQIPASPEAALFRPGKPRKVMA